MDKTIKIMIRKDRYFMKIKQNEMIKKREKLKIKSFLFLIYPHIVVGLMMRIWITGFSLNN